MRISNTSFKEYDKVFIAFSGGVDSVVLTDIVIRVLRSVHKKPILLHYNHSDIGANDAVAFTKAFAVKNDVECVIGNLAADRPNKTSPEEWFRINRYDFLSQFANDDSVVLLGHNLDDVLETWIFSCFNGNPKIMCERYNDHIVRPIIYNTKAEILDHANHFNLEWCEDSNNECLDIPRCRIRHNVVKEALAINKGVYKTMIKKIKNCVNRY